MTTKKTIFLYQPVRLKNNCFQSSSDKNNASRDIREWKKAITIDNTKRNMM